MQKIKPIYLFFSLILIILSACSHQQPNDPVITPTLKPTSPEPTTSPEHIEDQLPSPETISSGPLLLIETDFNQFDYLDIKTGTTHPFFIPDMAGRIILASARSPNGNQILYRTTSGTYQTINLVNNEIGPVNNKLDISRFNPALAADEAFANLPDIKFSQEAMLDAVENALTTSMQITRFFNTDDDFLTVQVTGETATSLHHYDRNNEQILRLENAPGLVEDFWLSPDGTKVLVMKAYAFEPSLWQGRRYYIIDVQSQELTAVPLPDNVDRPNVSWLNPHTLSITHQTEPVGGIDFSVLDIDTMALKQIVQGEFSGLRRYGNNLLLIHHNYEDSTTRIAQLNLNGETMQSIMIDAVCFFQTQIGTRIVLNCEQESMLLDSDFEVRTLGEPIALVSSSPDGQHILFVEREGKIYFSEQNMLEKQEIKELSGTPLEIRWLPDSSGFLYRVQGQLHYYDFSINQSQLLLESNVFSDYANINAIWVDFE